MSFLKRLFGKRDRGSRVEDTGAQPASRQGPSTPARPSSVRASPVEALQDLKARVGALPVQHPANVMARVPRSETQIPWICRTLDEAATALTSRRDPFGNPITAAQVKSGLKQLVGMVRDPSYITQMEMAYPGIGKPLERYMDEVEQVIGRI
jgi:hypothetical protein